jgi:hypothetical protein
MNLPLTLAEIDKLIEMGENHLKRDINAHEKLQVEACLKSLRTLKESLQGSTNV